MDEDWHESFLKANANLDYMANRLADCLRNCMRAVAAGDAASPCYRAVRDFEVLLKLIVRSDGVPLYALFEKAIDELRRKSDDLSRDEVSSEWRADRYYERSIVGAAESGLQFLVESSCMDNAAGGRASTRKRNFLLAIKNVEEARQEMVREANARWQSSRPTPARKQRKKAE
jgi:hypothetical protein